MVFLYSTYRMVHTRAHARGGWVREKGLNQGMAMSCYIFLTLTQRSRAMHAFLSLWCFCLHKRPHPPSDILSYAFFCSSHSLSDLLLVCLVLKWQDCPEPQLWGKRTDKKRDKNDRKRGSKTHQSGESAHALCLCPVSMPMLASAYWSVRFQKR